MSARPILLALLTLLCAGVSARADFQSCLADLRREAAGGGVPGGTFDRVMAGVTPDAKVLEAQAFQPEFKTPIWDYLATLVDEQKVREGAEMMRRHARELASAEARFGVDRHVIAAVWGVESDFGKVTGRWALPQALSTLACQAPRRRDYFRSELMATLQIVHRGDLAPEKLRGSWAGAFGQTQFMPSTYLRLAVDGDGDNRRDLVDSVADALHSTANYLAKNGWVTGAPWGYEVRAPAGYSGPSGRRAKEPASKWAARGVRRMDGSAPTGDAAAGLLLPAGPNGPGFLVFKNYDVAYSYNGADSYALAISLLSDRLKGRPGVQGAWPTPDRGLSRAERKEVQELLIRRGYSVGQPDGAIGAMTRAAIVDYQGRVGLTPDGRPGGLVLDALRSGR
ncbi:MAG: lytic murein transglycosylase family protein [Hyphomicrobiales bacterium]|nr:lytic murein transglycosylase family protein [Hyphomicrobiales bacterium]